MTALLRCKSCTPEVTDDVVDGPQVNLLQTSDHLTKQIPGDFREVNPSQVEVTQVAGRETVGEETQAVRRRGLGAGEVKLSQPGISINGEEGRDSFTAHLALPDLAVSPVTWEGGQRVHRLGDQRNLTEVSRGQVAQDHVP